MNQDKVGYLRLTYKDLKSILDLPEGVEIVGIGSGALVHGSGMDYGLRWEVDSFFVSIKRD